MPRCSQKVGLPARSGCGGFPEMHSRREPLRSAPGGGGRRSLPPRGASGRGAAAGLQDRAAPRVHFAPRLQIRCADAAAPSSRAQRRAAAANTAAAAAAGSRIAPLPGSRRSAARLPGARTPAPPPPPPAATPASLSSVEPFPGGAGRTRNSARPGSGSRASLGGGFSGDKGPGERIR